MHLRVSRLAATVILPVVTASVAIGCYVQIVIERPVEDGGPDNVDAGDHGSSPDAASEEDAGPSCTGDCVPLNPWNFSLPMLVWVGPADQPPACPEDVASTLEGTFHADLVVPAGDCEPCSCKPSTGSCALPDDMTARAGICYSSTAETSFDPPANWDGSCSATNPIPAQAQCPPGSGIPCVQSLTISALQRIDETCEPPLPDPPKATSFTPPHWNVTAVVCNGMTNDGYGGCNDDAQMCVPAADPDSGFRHCVMKEGDHECDDDRYPEKHLVYETYEDHRNCTACTCGGPPEDSLCTATLSVFKDGVCTNPLFLGVPIASDSPSCLDLVPKGQSLGSKSVTNITYHPGTCAPGGGELEGPVNLVGPVTICCKP